MSAAVHLSAGMTDADSLSDFAGTLLDGLVAHSCDTTFMLVEA